MSVKIPQAEPKTDEIKMLHSGAWEIRNDCKIARWKLDAETVIEPAGADKSLLHKMPMVIIGYTTYFGVVPAISSFEGLEKQFKMMGIKTQGLTPEDYYNVAYERLAKYWGYVLFLPIGHLTNPDTLPENVVCGTLIKSTGLNKPVTGLLGNRGLMDQLQLAGLAPSEVITTASIERTHEAPGSGQDVNGVVWSYQLPKTKEEKALVEKVKTWLPDHSRYLDQLLPKQTLRGCVEVDILRAHEQERLAAQAEAMGRNFSFAPELAVLPFNSTIDVHAIESSAEDVAA